MKKLMLVALFSLLFIFTSSSLAYNITSCGIELNESYYVLQNNITVNSDYCFNVTTDNITIDLNGYNIDANGNSIFYFYTVPSIIKVLNGSLEGSGDFAYDGTYSDKIVIENVTVGNLYNFNTNKLILNNSYISEYLDSYEGNCEIYNSNGDSIHCYNFDLISNSNFNLLRTDDIDFTFTNSYVINFEYYIRDSGGTFYFKHYNGIDNDRVLIGTNNVNLICNDRLYGSSYIEVANVGGISNIHDISISNCDVNKILFYTNTSNVYINNATTHDVETGYGIYFDNKMVFENITIENSKLWGSAGYKNYGLSLSSKDIYHKDITIRNVDFNNSYIYFGFTRNLIAYGLENVKGVIFYDIIYPGWNDDVPHVKSCCNYIGNVYGTYDKDGYLIKGLNLDIVEILNTSASIEDSNINVIYLYEPSDVSIENTSYEHVEIEAECSFTEKINEISVKVYNTNNATSFYRNVIAASKSLINITDNTTDPVTMNYTIYNLKPNTKYYVYLNGNKTYELTTDSNGNLPTFQVEFHSPVNIVVKEVVTVPTGRLTELSSVSALLFSIIFGLGVSLVTVGFVWKEFKNVKISSDIGSLMEDLLRLAFIIIGLTLLTVLLGYVIGLV